MILNCDFQIMIYKLEDYGNILIKAIVVPLVIVPSIALACRCIATLSSFLCDLVISFSLYITWDLSVSGDHEPAPKYASVTDSGAASIMAIHYTEGTVSSHIASALGVYRFSSVNDRWSHIPCQLPSCPLCRRPCRWNPPISRQLLPVSCRRGEWPHKCFITDWWFSM